MKIKIVDVVTMKFCDDAAWAELSQKFVKKTESISVFPETNPGLSYHPALVSENIVIVGCLRPGPGPLPSPLKLSFL